MGNGDGASPKFGRKLRNSPKHRVLEANEVKALVYMIVLEISDTMLEDYSSPKYREQSGNGDAAEGRTHMETTAVGSPDCGPHTRRS